MSEYSRASSLDQEIVNLIKKYGDNELEVTEQDIHKISVIWYSPKTVPEWPSKTIKNPPHCIAWGMPVFAIILNKALFDDYSIETTRAYLFHELLKIRFDDNGNYKLVAPDIQDFSSLLTKIGLYYEKAEEMFSNSVLGLA